MGQIRDVCINYETKCPITPRRGSRNTSAASGRTSCPKGAPRSPALFQEAFESTPSTVMTLMVVAVDVLFIFFYSKEFQMYNRAQCC